MHELLAIVAERVDTWGWVNARVQVSPKGQKALPKKPLEIQRPGASAEEAAPKATPQQMSQKRKALFT